MALYDDSVPLDFDTREQMLLQQQARIKALRGIGAQPIQDPGESTGWTSAVTGTRIGGQTLKTPTAALLNPLIGTIGAELGEGKLNRDTTQLNADKQTDYEKLLAGVTPESSAQDFATLQRNPLSRALANKGVEDRLLQAPIRAEASRIALAKAVAEETRAKEANAARIKAAEIAHAGGGKGTWQDTKMVVGGSPVMANYTTRMLQTSDGKKSWSMDGPGGGGQGVGPIDATGGGGPAVDAGGGGGGAPVMTPTPTPMGQGTIDSAVSGANRSSVLTDLKAQYLALPPRQSAGGQDLKGVPEAISNRLPDVAKSGILGGDMQAHANFWSKFKEESNAQLRAMSGLAVTKGEEDRQTTTVPGPTTDPKDVAAWFDRQKQLIDLDVARKQAIAQDTRYRHWDPKVGAVVDTSTGKPVPVPGTESPWRIEVRGTSTSKPAAATAPTAPAGDVERKVPAATQAERDKDVVGALTMQRSNLQQRQKEIDAEIANTTYAPRLQELADEKRRIPIDLADLDREIARASKSAPKSNFPRTEAKAQDKAARPPAGASADDIAKFYLNKGK